MIPRATLRLQLRAAFDFDAARDILPYCAKLGISHLYLSPVTQARPGSPHGYDVIDPTRVNDELGGQAALQRLARRASELDIGLIADIVPNHMAADPRNPWWHDVLKRGRQSPHASTFDVNWETGDGRVLLPILVRPYGEALRAGEIRLALEDHVITVRAGGQSLPVASSGPLRPQDFDPDEEAGRARLHALLEQQHYRLAWWRSATDQLNWRRFFEVSELVGVRVEDPTVFDRTHALMLHLYGQGVFDGFRIDHVDGLAAPGEYLRRLRTALKRTDPRREPYLVVEKILGPDEHLDPRWPIEGATGYDFMDDACAVLHAPWARTPLKRLWQGLGGASTPVPEQIRATRTEILKQHLVAEHDALLAAWCQRATQDPEARDRGLQALGRVMDGWLAGFPTYRSYAEDGGPSAADRVAWEQATRAARLAIGPDDEPLLGRWRAELEHPAAGTPSLLPRVQQITPPLAAKSVEDTFFYRYGMLLSRNEVGSSPIRFCLETEKFHRRNHWRALHQPHGMLCTATHDHKRGEDARARLAVLTEMPGLWGQWAHEWLRLLPENACTNTDRYMLLQTLIGAWPPTWGPDVRAIAPDSIREWLGRVAQWQTKALREAKLRTSWTDPDEDYEAAAAACLAAIDPGAVDARPLAELARFAAFLVAPGQINSVAQTLLRNTSPGVPDLYQGAQAWDQSLVDPDNRRPVDWQALQALLATPEPLEPAASQWRNGRVKLHLIQTCLRLRADIPQAFESGYTPLRVRGLHASRVLAYLRGDGAQRVLVAVPRLCALPLAGYARDQRPTARDYWGDTAIMRPDGCSNRWVDRLARRELRAAPDGALPLSDVFRHWPVAVCASAD
jgi:(1->4)-alpha-D-glucan 1-alpha-D-glucosylmutase